MSTLKLWTVSVQALSDWWEDNCLRLAAALAKSGMQPEARQAAERFEADFSRGMTRKRDRQAARAYLGERFPFRRQEDQEHFMSALQQAGIIG